MGFIPACFCDSTQVPLCPAAPRFPAPPPGYFPCCTHCRRGTSARLLASPRSRRSPPRLLPHKSGFSLPPPRPTALPRSPLAGSAAPSPPRLKPCQAAQPALLPAVSAALPVSGLPSHPSHSPFLKAASRPAAPKALSSAPLTKPFLQHGRPPPSVPDRGEALCAADPAGFAVFPEPRSPFRSPTASFADLLVCKWKTGNGFGAGDAFVSFQADHSTVPRSLPAVPGPSVRLDPSRPIAEPPVTPSTDRPAPTERLVRAPTAGRSFGAAGAERRRRGKEAGGEGRGYANKGRGERR